MTAFPDGRTEKRRGRWKVNTTSTSTSRTILIDEDSYVL